MDFFSLVELLSFQLFNEDITIVGMKYRDFSEENATSVEIVDGGIGQEFIVVKFTSELGAFTFYPQLKFIPNQVNPPK